jgi:hypothetical protein
MIQQPPTTLTLTIANNEALSTAFNVDDWIGGLVVVPSAWTDANIGFKVAESSDGTYVILCTDAGVPIQISGITTNASKAYKIPTDIFPARWVKLWSKNTTAATTTDNNQGAARTLKVVLK